jgi:cytochrome c5
VGGERDMDDCGWSRRVRKWVESMHGHGVRGRSSMPLARGWSGTLDDWTESGPK